MIIEMIDDQPYLNEKQQTLIVEVVKKAAELLNLPDAIELDISIVSDETIHELNRQYRQIDRPTDVLSFAMTEVTSEFDVDFESLQLEDDDLEHDSSEDEDEEESLEWLPQHLGDIIISYPRAVEQAEAYGHSLERELAFLAVHGFLHLNGYDHQTEEESVKMFGLQEEVLAAYGLKREE